MVDATRLEPTLGDLEAESFAEQYVRRRNPDLIEDHLGMAMRRLVQAEDRQHALDDDTGMGQRHRIIDCRR
jgi:phage terminase Nu1 subunit (DNA packaging protein)